MGDTISNRFDRIDSTRDPPARPPATTKDPTVSATPHDHDAHPRPTIPRDRVLTARTAVFVVFALAGLVFASWASRIADTKAALGLSGRAGLTLFAASVGSVTGLPLAGRICDRIGASRSVALGTGVGLTGLLVVGLVVDARGPRLASRPACSSSVSASASGTSR